MNAIQKPLSGLKNVLQKPPEAFQGYQEQIYWASRKLDADMLLDFAIHRRQNKIEVEKALM
jgi:hypothetical protein